MNYLTQEARDPQGKPKENKRKELIEISRELLNYKIIELTNEYKT